MRLGFRSLLAIVPALALIAIAGCGRSSDADGPTGALEQAWRAYSTGDFDFAKGLFQEVADAKGISQQQRFSALLGLATSCHLRPKPELDAARRYYSRLCELGMDVATREGLLGLGLVEIAAGQTAEGQGYLSRLIGQYPDSVEADEATIHLADSLLRARRDAGQASRFVLPSEPSARRATGLLEDRLQARPDCILASAMHAMLGNRYIQEGRFADAVDHLRAALDAGIESSKSEATIVWQIARIADLELHDRQLAEEYYQRYVNGFPRSALYYRARVSLERVRAVGASQEGVPAS